MGISLACPTVPEQSLLFLLFLKVLESAQEIGGNKIMAYVLLCHILNRTFQCRKGVTQIGLIESVVYTLSMTWRDSADLYCTFVLSATSSVMFPHVFIIDIIPNFLQPMKLIITYV